MTWDVPTKDNCPECGQTMFRRSGRGRSKSFCINEKCPMFVPEDKRGYKKKPAAKSDKAAQEGEPAEVQPEEEKPAEKKTAARKTAAKKPAAKKTTAKKAAAKKTEAEE